MPTGARSRGVGPGRLMSVGVGMLLVLGCSDYPNYGYLQETRVLAQGDTAMRVEYDNSGMLRGWEGAEHWCPRGAVRLSPSTRQRDLVRYNSWDCRPTIDELELRKHP